MRVLSYNIHKGLNVGNSKSILSHIKKALQETHADILFLQEVLGKPRSKQTPLKDWPQESQFEYLADAHWDYFSYGKNAVFQEGHHGNAILSKYPMLTWENIDISQTRFAKRGLLHATLEVPSLSEPLHTLCIHLDLLVKDQKQQMQLICDRVNDHVPPEAPLIVAGDANDWTQGAGKTLERIGLVDAYQQQYGTHAKTFPRGLPLLPLDRIYFRGLALTQVTCLKARPWSSLSDHLPLLADFDLS